MSATSSNKYKQGELKITSFFSTPFPHLFLFCVRASCQKPMRILFINVLRVVIYFFSFFCKISLFIFLFRSVFLSFFSLIPKRLLTFLSLLWYFILKDEKKKGVVLVSFFFLHENDTRTSLRHFLKRGDIKKRKREKKRNKKGTN